MKRARTGIAVLVVAALAAVAGADDDVAVTASPSKDDGHRISFDVGMFAGGFFASAEHEFYDPMTSTPVDLGTA